MGSLKHSHGPAFDEGVSQVTATPSTRIGSRRQVDGEEYVYCYNAGGATIAQGRGVKFVTAASGYSVAATCLTDVYSPFVGVAKNVALAAADYGWIMTRGFASVVVISAVTSDGLMIALQTDGKFVEASGTTVAGTATVVGHTLSCNTAAGGTVYAYFRGQA